MYNLPIFTSTHKSKLLKIAAGQTIKVYHRTANPNIADNIGRLGFMAGGGAAYGRGIYATRDLKSSLQNYNLSTYGAIIVESEVDLQDFLIFDMDFAKQVYGQNYKLRDQIFNEIGISKFNENFSKYEDLAHLAKDESDCFRQFTSDVAIRFHHRYGISRSGIRGIVFTGRNDGKVVVAYRETAIVPLRYSWIDGKTYKNPEWKDIPQQQVETLRELRENDQEEQKYLQDRRRLFKHLNVKNNSGNFHVSYEQFPNIPEKMIDAILAEWLYQDESRINLLDEETRKKFTDVIQIKFLLRKLESDPLLYWSDYHSLSEEEKERFPFETILKIYQNYIDRHPEKWIQLDRELRSALYPDTALEYFFKTIRKNEANWAYVPSDLIQSIQKKYKVRAPENVFNKSENLSTIYWQGLRPDTFSELTHETHVVVIPSAATDYVNNEIAKLNRRAVKLGLEPLHVRVIDEDRVSGYKKIEIIGARPIISGYKIVASLKPFKTSEEKFANQITLLSGDLVPVQQFINKNPICEHCYINRPRNTLYIISGDDGEYKLVGGSCLKDYIPHPSRDPLAIAKHAEAFSNMITMFGSLEENPSKEAVQQSFKKQGVPLPFFLAEVIRLTRNEEFVTSKQSFNNPNLTATGLKAFRSCLDKDTSQDDDLSSEEIATINAVIDWVNSLPDEPIFVNNNYLNTIYQIVQGGVVNQKLANTAASIIVAFKRKTEYQQDVPSLVGRIGDEIPFHGTIVEKKPIFISLHDTNNGGAKVNQVYWVVKNENDKYIAWGENEEKGGGVNHGEIGDIITVAGKVVGYSIYDRQTISVLDDVEIITLDTFNQKSIEMKKSQPETSTDDGDRPTEYKAGNEIEQEYTVIDTKSGVSGSGRSWTLYLLKDKWNGPQIMGRIGISAFGLIPPPKINEKVIVKGVVEINRYGYSLRDAVRVLPNIALQNVQHSIGEKIKIKAQCVEKYANNMYDNYQYLWFDETTGNKYTSYSTKEFEEGETYEVSGTIKFKRNDGAYALQRPSYRLISTVSPSQDNDSVKKDEDEDNLMSTSSSLNWYTRYLDGKNNI